MAYLIATATACQHINLYKNNQPHLPRDFFIYLEERETWGKDGLKIIIFSKKKEFEIVTSGRNNSRKTISKKQKAMLISEINKLDIKRNIDDISMAEDVNFYKLYLSVDDFDIVARWDAGANNQRLNNFYLFLCNEFDLKKSRSVGSIK